LRNPGLFGSEASAPVPAQDPPPQRIRATIESVKGATLALTGARAASDGVLEAAAITLGCGVSRPM
jgi:hypothetical protein